MDTSYGTLPPTAPRTAQKAPSRRVTALDMALARLYEKDPKTTPEMLAWAKGVRGAK